MEGGGPENVQRKFKSRRVSPEIRQDVVGERGGGHDDPGRSGSQ